MTKEKITRSLEMSIWFSHLISLVGLWLFTTIFMPPAGTVWFELAVVLLTILLCVVIRITFERPIFYIAAYGGIFALLLFFAYQEGILWTSAMVSALASILIEFDLHVLHWKKSYPPQEYEIQLHFFLEPILLYMYGALAGNIASKKGAIVLAIAFLLLHFWSSYLKGIAKHLFQSILLSDGEKAIIYDGTRRLVLGLLVVLFLALCFVAMFQYDELFLRIGRAIFAVLGFLYNQLMRFFAYIDSLLFKKPIQSGWMDGTNTLMEEMLEALASPFWTFVSQLLGMLICLLGIFLAVRRVREYFLSQELYVSPSTKKMSRIRNS